MKIDLHRHPDLIDLIATGVLHLDDVDVDSQQATASITQSTTEADGVLRLTIDHSHFTAKSTIFEIASRDAERLGVRVAAAVQRAIIDLQSSTVGMLASVNSAVINSLDGNEIVDNVLQEVMNVLPHCDAGVFRLYDEESGYLVPVAHAGLPDDYTHYRLEPNESVSGVVFATGHPAIHNGRQNIIDAHRVMRPESQSFMERSQIANALLCVPVMAEGKRLGTLTTLCFSADGAFSVFDRIVLESLASQIAVAYQRSLSYQMAIATSKRLEEMRNDLARKNVELDRSVKLHETLLHIFSTEDNLIEQLGAVSRLFNVEFRFENVVGLEFRSTNWADGPGKLIQDVEIAEAPIAHFHFDPVGDVSFKHVLFGTIAAFVAVDFIRNMSKMDALNARKKIHFETIAAGTDLDSRRSHLGFRVERFNQIVIAQAPQNQTSANAQLSIHRLVSDLHSAATSPNKLIFHDGDQIVMLFSASTTTALDRSLGTLSSLSEQLQIVAGASAIYDAADFHSAARVQAARASEALNRRGRAGLLKHADMGYELLLEGRERQDVLSFIRQILAPLLTDGKKTTHYETLSRYVQEGKSVALTADGLGIHPNTLYQRLAKMEILIGRKFSDTADFTIVSLACQLYDAYFRAPTSMNRSQTELLSTLQTEER